MLKNTLLTIYMIVLVLLNLGAWIGVPLASKMDDDVILVLIFMSSLSLFIIYNLSEGIKFNRLIELYEHDYDEHYMVAHNRNHSSNPS